MPSASGRRDRVFFALSAAVCGTFLAGSGISPAMLLVTAAAVFLLFRTGNGAFLIPAALILGFSYFHIYVFLESKSLSLPRGREPFYAVISESEARENGRKLEARLLPPYRGTITVLAETYPELAYGDRVLLSGRLKGDFMPYPRILSIEPGRGFPLRERLLALREDILGSYRALLPEKEALLLGGLTLGARGAFSPELKSEMARSGTTHLVALSGYNIGLIVLGIGTLFSSWVARRLLFALTVSIVVLFVMMTGGEASIIRASLMGCIALLAGEAGRLHDLRNSIAAAGALMALFDPRLPYFDLGYELSFMSMLGVAYLLPAIEGFLNLGPRPHSPVKEAVLSTLAAQAAVLPLLFSAFGTFSPGSVLANALILPAVPLTMFFGFLTGGAAFVSEFAAGAAAALAHVLLAYELWVIKLIANFPALRFALNPYLPLAYYAALLVFIRSYSNHEA